MSSKIREIHPGEDFEQYAAIRNAIGLGQGQEITPELSDARIEAAVNRRQVNVALAPDGSVISGILLNPYDLTAALRIPDTKNSQFLKNSVRAFCGWPAIGKLERVHLNEDGAELRWLTDLRARLRLQESTNAQTVLRTALAALPGDPWVDLKGACTSTLHGVLEALETNDVAQAKAHVRQCLKNFQEIERDGVPRVWIEEAKS